MKLFSFGKSFIKKLNLVGKLVGKPHPTNLPIGKVGSQSEVAPTDLKILSPSSYCPHHSSTIPPPPSCWADSLDYYLYKPGQSSPQALAANDQIYLSILGQRCAHTNPFEQMESPIG
ncbi:hypothetical protein LXL04_035318 [Taraxacum kok-saghyz]